jgi:hypothetical protein
MDPITIVASCVAVLQVLDRIAVLSSKFRGFLDAPNDAQRLINESLDLMIVLDRIKTFNATYPTRRDMIICELLVSCERILSRVENLVHTVVTNSRLHNPKVQKLVWFHKRRDVAVLRQELRDIKSALCLQFLVVTM